MWKRAGFDVFRKSDLGAWHCGDIGVGRGNIIISYDRIIRVRHVTVETIRTLRGRLNLPSTSPALYGLEFGAAFSFVRRETFTKKKKNTVYCFLYPHTYSRVPTCLMHLNFRPTEENPILTCVQLTLFSW